MFSAGLAEIVLIVEDVDRSARFYREVVDLTPEGEPESGWTWFWAGEPGWAQRVALRRGSLIFEERSPLPEGERWGRAHYAFDVPRKTLEKAVEHVRENGTEVLGPVYSDWMEPLSYDPEGNLIEFCPRIQNHHPQRPPRRQPMKAKGLVWLGTRTLKFDDTVRFFRDTLGLRAEHEEHDFAVYRLPNGDTVEVFGPGDTDHEHFATGPVVEFLVDDVREARTELEGAGIGFIGPVHESDDGASWAHFTGPDGYVYGITRPAGSDDAHVQTY